MDSDLSLSVLAGELAVCRLPADAPAPAEPDERGSLFSVTRTATELSVVCPVSAAPEGATVETGWRALVVAGTLEFAMVGILSRLSSALADAGVSLFAISTYDTDYLLVQDLDGAVAALRGAGHQVTT